MTLATDGETEATSNGEAAEAATRSEAPRGHGRLECGTLAILCLLMLAQMWSSVVQLSITSDEIDHLHAGYRYWQCNDFGWNPEHPPLVKIVAGLPLQAMRINDPIPNACGAANSKELDFLAGRSFIFANPEKMLRAARFAVSFYALLLLLTVWLFARKAFGVSVAIVAGILTAFEPNFLAHGALITTDIAASAGMLLAVYATYNYVREPNKTRLLAVGLAAGFALAAKHSSVLLVLIIPALLLIDAALFGKDQRVRIGLRHLGALIVIAAVAWAVLWAAYGFRYAARPRNAPVWIPPRIERAHGFVATQIIPNMERWKLAPQSYLAGLQDVLVRSETGVPSFVFGKIYHSGRWFYFPAAIAVKYTLPVLLMLLVSLASWRFWKSRQRELLFLALPPLLYFGISLGSKLNIGSRHLLPVLPFAILIASAGAWNLAEKKKWGMIALVAALAFDGLSSLHAFPNYLSYSNELWGGPARTYRYLAYSDADWGQAQKMARDYLERTHPASCVLIRTYNNKNTDYGIPCSGISEIQWDPLHTPYTGTIIVSSTLVDGVGLWGPDYEIRRVFKDLKPVAQLGGSALLVYQGTFDLGPLVAYQLLVEARRAGVTDPQAALEDARQAATLDPSNGDAHIVMCSSYDVSGNTAAAEQECAVGLKLIRNNPKYTAEQVRDLERFIRNKGLAIDSAGSEVEPSGSR